MLDRVNLVRRIHYLIHTRERCYQVEDLLLEHIVYMNVAPSRDTAMAE